MKCLYRRNGEPFFRDLNEVVAQDVFLQPPATYLSPQVESDSVASNSASTNDSISPPIDLDRESLVDPALGPAASRRAYHASLRRHIQQQYTSAVFGSDPAFRGTPFHLNHFAVSRCHFTVCLVPVPEARNDPILKSCLPADITEHFDETDAHLPSEDDDVKQRKKRNPITSRRHEAIIKTSHICSRRRSPAVACERVVDDERNASLLLLIAWSPNPTYVNETRVTVGQAIILLPGDVLSVLECAFDAHRGICSHNVVTEGADVVSVMYDWKKECGLAAGGVPDATAVGNEKQGRASLCSSHRSESMVLDEDRMEDGVLITCQDEVEAPAYHSDDLLWESPLRSGFSSRDERPLPVWQVRLRDCSPENSTSTCLRYSAVRAKLDFDEEKSSAPNVESGTTKKPSKKRTRPL